MHHGPSDTPNESLSAFIRLQLFRGGLAGISQMVLSCLFNALRRYWYLLIAMTVITVGSQEL